MSGPYAVRERKGRAIYCAACGYEIPYAEVYIKVPGWLYDVACRAAARRCVDRQLNEAALDSAVPLKHLAELRQASAMLAPEAWVPARLAQRSRELREGAHA